MQYPRIRGLVVALCAGILAMTGCSEATAVADATSRSGPGGGGVVTQVTAVGIPSGPVCVKNGPVTFDVVASDNLGGDVTWSSSNEAVMTVVSAGVNLGRVTVKAAGSAFLFAASMKTPAIRSVSEIRGTVDCGDTQPPPSGGNSITMSPPGGSYPVGTVLDASVTCVVTSGTCVPWWYSENPEIISVNPNTGVLTFLMAGSTRICVQRSQSDQSLRVCHTFVSTSGSTNPPPTSGPITFGNDGPFSLNTGTGCQLQHQIVANQPLNWSSSNPSLATVSGDGTNVGTVNIVPNSSGAVTITGRTLDNAYSKGVTYYLSNTNCTTTTNPSVSSLVVSPKNLNLLIGQMGSLFATITYSGGGSTPPTINWVATLNCVQLMNPNSNGTQVTVNAVRACRDSVVATAGGRSDFAIVVVTSGVNSIDYTPPGGTIAVNATQNLTATCTLASGATCTPYWYSTDPSRVTVVGAPSQVVIAGVSYPAGPTATIKRLAPGSVQICAQAAVQDPTIRRCYTWN